jgi:hypothetical protein
MSRIRVEYKATVVCDIASFFYALTQMTEEDHYSPATEGGKDSGLVARKVSRAMTAEYDAFKAHVNDSVERFSYLPPGQARDDLWSGTPAETVLTRSNQSVLMNRTASVVTKVDRGASVVDYGVAVDDQTLKKHVSFFEATKSRGT